MNVNYIARNDITGVVCKTFKTKRGAIRWVTKSKKTFIGRISPQSMGVSIYKVEK